MAVKINVKLKDSVGLAGITVCLRQVEHGQTKIKFMMTTHQPLSIHTQTVESINK